MREAPGNKPLTRYYRSRYERFLLLLKWRELLPPLQQAVCDSAPDAQVYVFGSALRGELTAGSDVDVLVVSGMAKGPRRHKLAAEIEAKLEEKIPHGVFEFHVVEPRRLEWYKRHAKGLRALSSLEK